MQELDKRQVELQRKIEQHQEEASQEIESIDEVEEERKRQVPRLKTQLSLYASTTGIKWDFSDTTTLSGSVVSKCGKKKKYGTDDENEQKMKTQILHVLCDSSVLFFLLFGCRRLK